MKTNVRGYTDKELLKRVMSLPSFDGLPNGYWLLGVQSNEDEYNVFDDKFYLFYEDRFIMVTSGTTNAGLSGLKGFSKYNRHGCAVIKTNEWFYEIWKPGLHRGKMKALRQVKPIKYYRDWNKNQKAEQLGTLKEGIIGINFHTVIYGRVMGFVRRLIGGWSVGCQVANRTNDYYKILDYCSNQERVSYCLIEEF